MSTTTAATATTAVATDAPPPKPGKKKLMLIIGAAVLALALVGGGAAWFLLKKKADTEEDADEGTPAAATQTAAAAKHETKGAPPVFVPLDPFTVNLADREGERFAQVAVTLEIEDSHFSDQLRVYLPAIRNNILMLLAQKTAAELLTREGKELLAKQILRESLRPLGISVPDPAAEDDRAADDAAAKKKKAKGKKAAPPAYPIRSVQFASFIIQ